jgi:hypothetical protein
VSARRSLLLALAAIVALRAALLVCSQHWLCGDEATVGVMARHILEAGERPIFAYHEHYNGGSALTAYLATIPFSLWGDTEWALKLVPFALSLLALVVTALWVRAARGDRAALLCVLVYGTSVWLMKWNFDARGGYIECQSLLALVFWILHRGNVDPEGDGAASAALLGLLCGIGFYLFPLFLPAVIAAGLLVLARSWRRGVLVPCVAWVLGLAAGTAPLVLFQGDTAPLAADAGMLAERVGVAPVVFLRTLVHHLPAALAYDNLDNVPALRLVPNGIEFLLLVTGVAAALVLRRGRMREGSPTSVSMPSLELTLAAYIAVYLLLYSLHPLAGEESRHLLFLDPALSVLAGLGLSSLLSMPRSALRTASLALCCVAALNRAVQHARLMADDGVYGPLGRSEPGDADRILAFLDAHGVRHLMSEDWDLSWRVVFRSHERITSTHSDLWLRRLLKDYVTRQGDAYALVVEPGNPGRTHIHEVLHRYGVDAPRRIAGRDVYLLSRGLRSPGDVREAWGEKSTE